MHWVLEKKRTETIVDKAVDKPVDMWITFLWICGQVVDNLRQYGNALRTVLSTGCLNSGKPVFSPKGNSQTQQEVMMMVKQIESVGIDEVLGDDTGGFKIAPPALDSEQLRAAVEGCTENRTKDGKVYGVKLDTKGRVTAKQRLFASLIVQGDSPRDAYRKAYNCLTANESTIAVSANRLLKDAKISVLLQSSLDKREENLVSDAVATRRHVMTELLEHAQSMKSEGSKLKALELIGRAVGMFTDKVETKVEEVSTDQLKRELEGHLALLDQATKH